MVSPVFLRKELPDMSQMNITMNPEFVDDGADFVEVHVGQKSSAENRRLSNIMGEAGHRSSSMPPLSMPPRIMPHGNFAVGCPAFLGVHRQHADEANEPMPRESSTSTTTESESRTSTTSERTFSTDSGFNVCKCN